MDKVAASIFRGFSNELRGLKPMGKEKIRKIDSRKLRTEHSWAHRYDGHMKKNPNWGAAAGWTRLRLKQTHDDIVEEGEKRDLPWAENHRSPIFIRKKIRK